MNRLIRLGIWMLGCCHTECKLFLPMLACRNVIERNNMTSLEADELRTELKLTFDSLLRTRVRNEERASTSKHRSHLAG